LEAADSSLPDNIRFWRWLLTRVVPGQKEWNPPPADANAPGANADEEEADDEVSE
jgi:hypothetical protein